MTPEPLARSHAHDGRVVGSPSCPRRRVGRVMTVAPVWDRRVVGARSADRPRPDGHGDGPGLGAARHVGEADDPGSSGDAGVVAAPGGPSGWRGGW
jgi:hypothetical protein